MVYKMSNKSRYIRFFTGLVILALGAFYNSYFGLVGLIPLGFAVFNFCPLCHIKGYCKIKK